MRILLTMPHFFRAEAQDSVNRSRRAGAREERLRALVAAISGPHQSLGTATYGLDHGERIAWQAVPPQPARLDLVICTVGNSHLLDTIPALAPLFRHHVTATDPLLLGFECHKLLREARGCYDYYGYIEDDIVLLDPLFFRKRWLFDQRFGPEALLQPNRCEILPAGPVQKLYVDYRMNPRVTALDQDITQQKRLEMDFAGETIGFERSTYPSAGCFFLNAAQLERWIASPFFLDSDVSYLSPLDSAVTLSVMKAFRIYKPVLEQAWFLEVLHASPRWIDFVAKEIPRRIPGA
jgi:hypothetical protein